LNPGLSSLSTPGARRPWTVSSLICVGYESVSVGEPVGEWLAIYGCQGTRTTTVESLRMFPIQSSKNAEKVRRNWSDYAELVCIGWSQECNAPCVL